MRSLLLLLILFGSNHLLGQHQLQLEIGGGLGAGWWVYDKGLTDTLPRIHRGYDRTHLAMLWPAEAALNYASGKWEFGLGIGPRYLAGDRMVGSEHRRGGFRKYTVSVEGRSGIPIRYGFIQARTYLLQHDKFWLGVHGRVGLFQMIHNHPRQETFQLHLSQEIGIMHLIPLSPHVSFYVHPQFSNFRVSTKNGFEGERHNIYTLALFLGLRGRIYSSSP